MDWNWSKRHYLKHPLHWVKDFRNNIIAAYQRAKYGWAKRDCWNLDHHLLKILPEMLHYLADNCQGCPADMEYDVWKTYLNNIAYLLENSREEVRDQKNEYHYNHTIEIDEESMKHIKRDQELFEEQRIMISEAFKMLSERFFDMWD